MLYNIILLILWGFTLVSATGDDDHSLDTTKGKNRVIFNAVSLIRNETRKLDEMLHQWDGSLTGALAINGQNGVIMDAIEQGTKQAEESDQLHVSGALKLNGETKRMIKDTRNCTQDLIYMKDRFRAITLGGKVKGNLRRMMEASDEMNKVVVRKLPPIGRGIGRAKGRKVHNLFQNAIDHYESKEPAPLPPPPSSTKTKMPKPTKTKKPKPTKTKKPKPTKTKTPEPVDEAPTHVSVTATTMITETRSEPTGE